MDYSFEAYTKKGKNLQTLKPAELKMKIKLKTMKKGLLKLIASKLFLAVGACLTFSSASAQTTVITVKDSITGNVHWTNDNIYFLQGYVYVVNGSVLTIDAGTLIKGDKDTKGSLIIEQGAKIMAQGSAKAPIVFTSNQPVGERTYGDWGGVILCGKAPVNWSTGKGQVEGGPRSLYGGTDPHDNSGILSYVRCEFAGVAFSPNNEINGITFCGVGDATQLDHLQVSYSGDDSYEWFGGTVNGKYFVAYRGWDDDFDTDNGYSGKNQFFVGLRDPFSADQSGSKAFESDSYQSGTNDGKSDTTHLTKCVFANSTVVGGLVSPTSTAYDPQFVAAAHIRRGSSISILNSLLIGYPAGILIDESSASFASTTANIRDSICQIKGVAVAGIPTNATPAHKELMYIIDGARSLTPTITEADTTTNNPFAPYTGPFSWFNNSKYKNHIVATEQTGLRLQNPFNLTSPNFVPTSTSAICYNNKALPSYMTNMSHFATADPFSNGKVYPFNPTLPINTDTTQWFKNYNAPAFVPATSYKLDNFFDKVNFIGAFPGTQTLADDWTRGWCNFDPINTDYSKPQSVNQIAQKSVGVRVYPNPASENATVVVDLSDNAMLTTHLYDVTGKLIFSTEAQQLSTGTHYVMVNTSQLTSGIYYIQTVAGTTVETTKLVVR